MCVFEYIQCVCVCVCERVMPYLTVVLSDCVVLSIWI